MKIAYVTIHVAPEIMQGGVGKKIKSQINIWRENGHEVALFCLTPTTIPFPGEYLFTFESHANLLQREISRAKALGKMIPTIYSYKPDIIYLRFGLYSYPLHRVFNIAPVVLETNSNDIQEYHKRGIFFYWLNQLTRNLIFSPAKGIVTPTHELVEVLLPKQNKPVCVISNGMDLGDVMPLPPTKNEKPVITLVCSPGMKWHGVDKLIKLANLFQDISVNIVGYSQKDIGMPVPHNVNLLGFLNQQQVQNVLAETDVACGSFALHRNNMNEASVLKVREALSFGIPVIIPYHDTDLHKLSLETILRIPNTEDNVMQNAERIYKFAYDMIGRRLDVNAVAPYLDQRLKEEVRLGFFKMVLDDLRCK